MFLICTLHNIPIIVLLFITFVGIRIIDHGMDIYYKMKISIYSSFIQLYSEVRAKREGTRLDGRMQNNDVENGLSVPSTSTGSSLHSDNSRSDPTGSSSQSEPVRFSSLPGFVQSRNISGLVDTVGHHSPCFLGDSLFEQSNAGSQFTLTEHPQHKVMDGSSSRGTWQQHTDNKEALDATEHGAIFQGSAGHSTPQTTAGNDSEENVILRESPLWSESSCGSEKNRNMTALNAVSVSNYFCVW